MARPRRPIDRVLLHKMAAGKGSLNCVKLYTLALGFYSFYKSMNAHVCQFWMKHVKMVVDSRGPRQLTGAIIL